MKRRFTLSVFAIMLIAITAPSNQIQAQYTYVVVQSDGFESEFRNWSNGSAEGLDTEKTILLIKAWTTDRSCKRQPTNTAGKMPTACASVAISVLSVILYAPIRLDTLI